MTLDEAKSLVTSIELSSGDAEVAHEMEDDLYRQFIKFVAISDNRQLSEIAVEILRTSEIDFCRWCA